MSGLRDRGSSAPPATSRATVAVIAEFPIRDGCRDSRPPSSKISLWPRGNAGNCDVVEEPTAAELAVLRCLATGLSRREIGGRLCSR